MSLIIKNVLLNDRKKDILIHQEKFAAIEDRLDCVADEVIDAEGKIMIPAFYNTHTHAAMVLLRGLGEDKALQQWLLEDIWPLEEKITPEMMYHASRFAVLEMIKTGTVFFSDMYFYPETTMKAVDEMGIKAALGIVGMDCFDSKKCAEKKEAMAAFLAEPAPSARILKTLLCHSIYTTSDELISFAVQQAREKNAFLHIHASETRKEVDDCVQKEGCSPIEKLDRLGALTDRTILAHCVHLSEADRALLANRHSVIAHCPASNFKLNSGRMPFQTYLDNGCRLSLGTDGAASSNALDMFSQMRVAAFNAKSAADDSCAGKAQDIFDMATKNGADAFSLNAGEIQVGKAADFLLLDSAHYSLYPRHSLISNLVYSANSSCITDVFCNGRAVMRQGQVPDENRIRDSFERVCRDLTGN